MQLQKVTPFLWFEKDAEKASEFYVSLFPGSRVLQASPMVTTFELAVVQLAGRYLLVARDIAMQAQAIQPESLVLLCDPDAPAEDDVPADLMW